MAIDFIRRMTRARLGVALVALSIPLLLLLLFFWWRIEAGAQRLLVPLRWFGDVAYESMSVDFDGTVRFEKLRFQPYPGMRGGPITAESVAIATPGLTWLLNGGLSRSVTDVADLRANLPTRLAKRIGDSSGWSLPPASTLQASIEGVELAGEPPEIPGFEWLGFTSASPFESYGCGATRHWTRADLKAMGLSDTRQRMRVGFEAIANDLTDVTARLETDNASAAQFTLRLRLPDASRIMNTDWRAAHIALRSWQVEDAGFVMSRNWFCARRVGVSRLEFVEHHLSAIRRSLFEQGAVPAAALSAAYRRFVERGGELSLESRPSGTPSIADFSRAPPAERLRELNAMLKTRGGPAVPFTLDYDAAKLAAFMGPPTLEDQVRMGYVPPPAAPAVVVAAPVTATPAVVPAAPPAPSPAPPVVASIEPKPVATPRPSVPLEPVPVGTPVGPNAPAPTPAPGPAPVAGSIPYAQLPKYVGRTITVRTTLGGRRTGVLMAHNNQAITLKLRHAREGELELTIPQNTIRSVVAAGVASIDNGADGAEAN